MYSLLIVSLTFFSAVLTATEEVFVETPEGPQLLNGFTFYTELLSLQENYLARKSRAAAYFLLEHSAVPVSELFSNMNTLDFVLIQILHGLYSEDTDSLHHLANLVVLVGDMQSNGKESMGIRNTIIFPPEGSYKVIKSLITLDSKGIMKMPSIVVEEILGVVSMEAAMEKATELGNMDVITWVLEYKVRFDNVQTLFESAFSNNRTDMAKLLIGKGALDNFRGDLTGLRGPREETLLHVAAQAQRPAAVSALLATGMAPDRADEDGYTALHRAVASGDERAAALLLRAGADVNRPTASGDLPLHVAVSQGDVAMTKLLIKAGSLLDAKNDLGFTPLYVAENAVVAAVLRYIEDIRWEQRMNESKSHREDLYLKYHGKNGVSRPGLNSIFLDDINDFFTNINMREIFCRDNDIPFIISLSEIVNLFLRKGEVSRMSSHLQFLLKLKASKIEKEELSEIMINLGYDTPDINIKPILDSIENLNADFMTFDENVRFKNETGHTNLHITASQGDLKAVKALVSKGADVQARTNDSWTPLHFAAAQGHAKIVQFLLHNNASINAKTWNRETPLHLASANDRSRVVKILLENGADVNAEMSPDCMTPLYVASRAGHSEVVELLVEYDASLSQEDCGRYNLRPLQIAALTGQVAVVRLLARGGAQVDERDSEGSTPLYTAAHDGRDQVVRALIELGAEVDLRVGKAGFMAIHAAAWMGRVGAVRALLEGGAAPGSGDLGRATPLHWAATSGVASLLLEGGASVHARTVTKETPLHRASSSGRADVVMELLRHGADIDAKTIDGKTPAFEAILRNQFSSLKVLVENGADLNAVGPNGQTVANFGVSRGMLKFSSG